MSHPLPAKPSTARPTPTPTIIPAALNPSAPLLLSAIALPTGAAVVCRAWTGPDDAIDAARRHITDVAAGAPDVASALATVVHPDVELSLWAFAVVATDMTAPRLDALDFTTLGLKETTPTLARFELAHLYPCSAACARGSVPCAECTKPRTPTACPLARTAPRSARPVRRPLRALYVLWTSALRGLVIERLSHPRLLGTRNGVLVCPPDEPTGEWGRPWSDPTRSLIHAHVHISLAHPIPRPSAPSHILIHLLPQSTTLLPLLSTPPVPGTPLLLLPSSISAYAIAPYTGPAPHGFLQSLAGRGVPPSAAASQCLLIWLPLPSTSHPATASPQNVNALPTPSAATPAATAAGAGARGMYAIWPRALCVVDTSASAIDVARLPSAPVGLTGTATTAPYSKPRRFPLRTPKLSRPIFFTQPSNQAPPATPATASTSTSAGAQPPSLDMDPAMSALANIAASLIDAVVRAREREKERQRARMERARSGSAVPIPPISGGGLAAGTGPSTPVDSLLSSTSTVPPSLQIQTQMQTPSATSAMYMSPLGNTPMQQLGAGTPLQQQHTPLQQFHSTNTNSGAAMTMNNSTAAEVMSPAHSDTTFSNGRDLFGDDLVFSEGFAGGDSGFGVGSEVGGGFGADTFGMDGAYAYDPTGGSSIPFHSGGPNSVVSAGLYPTRPYEPELFEDLWNGGAAKVEDPKASVAVAQAEDDDMGTIGDDEFDYLDSWGGPSVGAGIGGALDAATELNANIDAVPSLEGMDLDPGAGADPTSPPMSTSTSTPTPIAQTSKPLTRTRTEPKPYFPLTPPAEENLDPGGGRAGWSEPLKFTQKFEGVDEKYRGLDGKFMFRLGGTSLGGVAGQAKAIAGGTGMSVPSGSWAAGTVARAAQPSIPPPSRSWSSGSSLGQGAFGSTLAYPMTQVRLQPQAQAQSRPRAQSQSQVPTHIYPKSQLQLHFQQPQLQLPTPHPSPGALRRLRAGYVGLTNPSAKRIRTLKLAHTKPAAGTTVGTLSVFARDWEIGDTRADVKLRREGEPSSPTATTIMSDAEMDTDSDESDADGGMSIATGHGFSAPSRGTSPPPSASVSGIGTGPPGPSLLLALFRPSALASGTLGEVLLCIDPREPKTPAPGPISVPTPVSPGDVLESSKATIEGIANVLAREAIDNWAWGMDIGVCAMAMHAPAPTRAELMLLGACLSAVAPAMTVARLATAPKVEMVSEVLTDRLYPHLPRTEKLRQPKLSVGHSGQVVQMSVPALKFWDTIGLEPIGGPKNVLGFAVYEAGDEKDKDTSEETKVVTRWLENLGEVYQSRKLGKHTPGMFGGAQKGVLKARLENLTDILVNVVMNLADRSFYAVFYIILPQRVLSSPKFQSVFSSLKSHSLFSTTSHYFEYSTIHLIPSNIVFNHDTTPFESRQQLESIALGVYDRIPRTIARRARRTILPLAHPDQTLVQVPAFTLARPLAPRFRFSMGWPDGQREVMDRHMFLHVAYGFSKSRQWLGATCVDERGEAYETKLWRVAGNAGEDGVGEADGQGADAVQSDVPMSKVVAKVWAFAMRFAKRAAIEWRIVFCRMGVMDAEELEAWESHTSNEMSDAQIGLHVSILSFDHASGLTMSSGLAPSFKAPSATPGLPASVVIDLTANDYVVLPGFDSEICANPGLSISIDNTEFGLLPLASAYFLRLTDPHIIRPMNKIPEPSTKADEPPTTSLSSQLHLLHVALTRNSSLWKSGGDPWRELIQSFYSLSALTQTRLPSLDPLPVHLAMLIVIRNIADNRDIIPVEPTPDSA